MRTHSCGGRDPDLRRHSSSYVCCSTTSRHWVRAAFQLVSCEDTELQYWLGHTACQHRAR